MAGTADFERALSALLTGDAIDLVPGPLGQGDGCFEALRVLSAIGQTSQTVLFGGTAPSRDAVRWGHLEIRGEIGRGTSGTVYRAWDMRLAREVALKLFDPDSASANAAIAEGRLLARLRHPNIVTVYGADTCDGVAGLWMELIEGDSLDDIVERDGPMGVEDALLVGIDLAGALSAVHAAGMLHRDVKARNVVRQRGGRLVLMDFGAGYGAAQAPEMGDAVGTPLYMAPEVLSGDAASAQNDIYGLGVLLYHVVTGSYPVMAQDLAALVAAHRSGTRRSLQRAAPWVPDAVHAVIDRACAPEPQSRFTSAQQFESALTDALAIVISDRTRVVPALVRGWRRWRRLVLRAAAALAGIVLVAWLGWNTGPGRATRRLAGLSVPPRGNLYMTFGGGVAVLSHGTLRVFPGSNQGANALAASREDGIRMTASAPPWLGDAWFRLDGTPVRAPDSESSGRCCYYDGTTDGHFNYALWQDSTLLDPIGSRPLAPPAVHRFDREWRNRRVLFDVDVSTAGVTSRVYYGIAYDGASRTVWVSRSEQDGTAHADQWTLGGRKLSTIELASGSTTLAVDPSDGTLWALRDEANSVQTHFDNYTTTGRRLGTFSIDRLNGVGIGGVEFEWTATP